ncbi:MAG: hypothetical protein IPP13_03475 [Kouleothrix sp.]|jgi:dihydrodipicolinate reductase|nr:hypothetical protein [Kouleothrix sp.]
MLQASSPDNPEPTVEPPTPPRRFRTWIFWTAGALALVLIACCAIAGFGGFRLFQTLQGEADQAILTIDQFMRAGMHRDIPAAMRLFAPSAGVATTDLNRLFEERADAFVGFTQAHQTSFNVQSDTSGTTARISGTLSYTGHADRGFSATLRKERGAWLLISIQFSDGVGA